MAQYQLKVMLNTSIPEKSGYIELTSDILDYSPPDGKGKKTLVKYPFFDPYADYPRQEIQDLEYHKRLEVFFNEEKFKSVVMEYSNKKNGTIAGDVKKGGGGADALRSNGSKNLNDGSSIENGKKGKAINKKKTDNKAVITTKEEDDNVEAEDDNDEEEEAENVEAEDNNDEEEEADDETKERNRKLAADEEEKERKRQKKISNFEFTIQTILCTGFPVNNYFQSMEYYDPSIRTKSLTLKGSSWFPFLPGRFDRKFSYLKIGGGLYTVSGVVWVNDALNHPKYLPVLESYGKYNEEKNPTELDKKQGELKDRMELEMNLFILNLYRDNLNQNSTVWISKNVSNLNRSKQTDRLNVNEILSYDIQIAFQEDVLRQLYNAPEIVDLFEELKVKDNSGNDYYYSSVHNTEDNIFLNRGESEDSKTELNEIHALKKDDKNKAYFYWKMLHENLIKYEEIDGNRKKISEKKHKDSIEYLIRHTNDTGIFDVKDHKVNNTEIVDGTELYFKKIYDTYKKKQTFKQFTDVSLNAFLDDYSLTAKHKQAPDKTYWLYKTLIENYKDIKERDKNLRNDKPNLTINAERIKAYEIIVPLMNLFIDTTDSNGSVKEENRNQTVKDGLNKFLLKFSLSDISKLSNATYKNELEIFAKKMATFEIEKKTYNYVLSNTDFADDPNKTQIEGIIAEKFKHFNVYSSSLKELATTRIVSNPFWKVETDKFVGIKKGKIVLSTDKNKENIFEELTICKDNNSKCKNKKAADLLYTELDELRFPVDKNAKSVGFQTPNVYEAYIQTNVIKGKITKENYGKLKCAYLNYSLGAMYQRMKKKTRENYIIKNKVYFDLEKEIKKAEADLVKQKPPDKKNAKKDTKTNNPQVKKGGRRSRKQRRFVKTRKRKSLIKNMKNETRKYRNDYSS
jgi:hypothetical protein